MAEILVAVTDNDNEVNWMPIDEGDLDLSWHDAEVRDKVIDEIIEILNSTPWTSIEQITHYLEEIKGENYE